MALGQATKKTLNRSRLVRVGKKLRKRINPFLKQQSRIPDKAVYPASDFTWTADLEAQWRDIQAEARAITALQAAIPPISDISPDHARLDTEKKWRSYFMWGYGFKSRANCARCPKTTALLENIPGLRTALFSIHAPGMTITPHKGVTAGVIVHHLGLIIPAARENCAIRVADEIVHWREGEMFGFDDTRKHETWNKTSEQRVILLLHVDRPLRFRGWILSKIFMAGIRWSPFVRDAKRAMADWDRAFTKLETQKK